MLRCKSGFTLIELLVVMVIIAAAAGIVAPIAYKSADKFNALLDRKETVDMKKEADYLSFIKNTSCTVKKQVIVCDNTSYHSLKDALR